MDKKVSAIAPGGQDGAMTEQAPFQRASAVGAQPSSILPGGALLGEAGEQPGRANSPAASYAALDLGTNNCRLLIARPSADGFRVIDSFSRIIRLGEGLTASGLISDAAIERAMAALQICRDKIMARHTTRTRLIATEACRSADNAAAFCARVEDELGLTLEIVDRETEARLAVLGCMPLLDPAAEGAILFDIGGGSTELVCITSSANGGPAEISAWTSLPAGVVTLAERHGGVDVTPALYQTMIDEISGYLAPFVGKHRRDLTGFHLLGTSGTVTTVAGIHLGLPRYDRRVVDGLWMDRPDVDDTVTRLRGMSYQQRVAHGCIGSERADLVLAGCAIFDAIQNAFPCSRVRIADRGLREGMLVQMMREDGLVA
jgi:exopolyphosphatase/guanosine-5'-triphosphate,3'-diphosphate pyrophosphatase